MRKSSAARIERASGVMADIIGRVMICGRRGAVWGGALVRYAGE